MLRKQLRIYSLALFTVLICSTSAYCQSISLTHSNSPNETTIGIGSNASIVLFSEGTNLPAVDSLELSISPASLIQLFSDFVATPEITNISGLGIFEGATTSFTPFSPLNGFPNRSDAEAVFSIPSSTALVDNAPIAEIFFDTSELSEGNLFNYSISGVFLNGNERFEANNAFNFVATVVPEPSSAAFMLALGSVAMLRRKRT